MLNLNGVFLYQFNLTPTPSPCPPTDMAPLWVFLDPFSWPNLLEAKSLYPFHTFSQLLFFKRFPVSLDWTEKKIFSHWPFCEFRPKIEFKQLKKFEMTVKVSETFMLCWTSSLEYIKTIRLNLNRYFRIQPPIPSNFMFKIFPKVYHTFGHTRTSNYRPTDKRRPPGEPQGIS